MSSLKSCVAPAALAVLLLAATAAGWGLESPLHEIEVRSLSSASAPRFLGSLVLLTYQSPHRVRLVGARFAHEDYGVFHTYSRNENEVFLLLLEVPPGVEELRYRICVDGVWMNDPNNPQAERDAFGTVFSRFSLRERAPRPLRSPVIEPNGSVIFTFRSSPGRRVFLTGSFNNWDPFWDRMVEGEPGLYRIRLTLPPGKHYYRFSVDGDRLTDPLNLDSALDRDGNPVSMVEVPPLPPAHLSLYRSPSR